MVTQGRQSCQDWGTEIIDRLSPDLRESFPEIKGLLQS
jgi:hypothetical protein